MDLASCTPEAVACDDTGTVTDWRFVLLEVAAGVVLLAVLVLVAVEYRVDQVAAAIAVGSTTELPAAPPAASGVDASPDLPLGSSFPSTASCESNVCSIG